MNETEEYKPLKEARRQRATYVVEYLFSVETLIAQEDRAQKRIEWLENRIIDC
jgi:hypothetical protein